MIYHSVSNTLRSLLYAIRFIKLLNLTHMSLLSYIFKATAYTGATLGVGVALLYKFQDRLLYFPQIPNRVPETNPVGLRNPGEANLKYEDVNITTPDGLKLHGWFVEAQSPRSAPTIILFHGRSGNIGHRVPFLAAINKYCGTNIFIVGYRGYSYSEGTPNEKGLQIDSLAAIDYVFSRNDIDLSKVFVLGNSMGGAITIYSVARTSHKIAGVIVENTFTSMSELLNTKYPFLRYIQPYIIRNNWESIKSITKIQAPILFISGLKDKLIPTLQMRKLYDAADSSAFREKIDIAEGTHNETWNIGEAEYFKGLKEFLDKVLAQQESNSKLHND